MSRFSRSPPLQKEKHKQGKDVSELLHIGAKENNRRKVDKRKKTTYTTKNCTISQTTLYTKEDDHNTNFLGN